MTAPRFTLVDVVRHEFPFTLRLPFRFGAITVRDGIQAVVRARIRLADGREGWGASAETLAAKWFDKDPALSDADNRDQLRRTIELAEATSLAAGANTAFGHFADSYEAQVAACGREALNPLVASFGRSLLDRAMLDALLRVEGVSFWAGMRANLGGLRAHAIAPDLSAFDFAALLDGLTPLRRVHARHTVGLVDPLTAADQTAPVGDGLPETLEEIATIRRHQYWKLKVAGDVAADVDRLCRIADVLDRAHGGYFATLDGNEQYADGEGALALWRAMAAEPRLRRLCASILYLEQPIARAKALATPLGALAAARPVMIDESDGPLDAFVTARGLGYTGVSTKACKGVWRSLINLARCRAWNAATPGGACFLSAEDLTCLPGLSVQQDLALVSLLGLTHSERNGHHFIRGFDGRPRAEAFAFAEHHPDLYADTPTGPRLRLTEGVLALDSLDTPGFGAAVLPDFSAMAPMPVVGPWRPAA